MRPSRSRPIASPRSMLNHTLPSGPVAIAVGICEASCTGYSTKCAEGPLGRRAKKAAPAAMAASPAPTAASKTAGAAAGAATWCSLRRSGNIAASAH